MDKIAKYEKIIIAYLTELGTDIADREEEHEEIITDTLHRHYFLWWLGFDDEQRFINQPLVHFHLKKDGKIWIFANLTEENLGDELILRGVNREDIVLGFHHRSVRAFSGFSVA